MAENHIQQERWALIAYVLMLMSLVLGVTWVVALWVNHTMLNQPHEVWIRSHQLWIIRSCFIFLLLLLLTGGLSLPLLWFPVSSTAGLVFAVSAGVMGLAAWCWMLLRSMKGLRRFMNGRAVY